MNADTLLLIGFETLKNNTVTIDGRSVDCIHDSTSLFSRKNYGMEAQDNSQISVKTSDIPTLRHNDTVSLNSRTWEVASISQGSAITQLTLANPGKL